MAYSDSTSIGELRDLSSSVLANNDVLKVGKRQMARIFLARLLDCDEESSYEILESTYRACSPREDIPEDVESFWTFVEKEYLNLEVEPKQKFVEVALKVVEDLGKISNNVNYIKGRIDALEKRVKGGEHLSAEDRYYKFQLEYYKEKNLIAKNEIVEFMMRDARDYAINESSVRSAYFSRRLKSESQYFHHSPYKFGRKVSAVLPDPYDVDGLDTKVHKFLDMPLSSYKMMIEDIRLSPEKFKEYAISYIKGDEVNKSLRLKLEAIIERSHILCCRKNVLQAMLRHFEEKDFLSFVSMAPLQIEGIFADICREVKIPESKLDASSLNDKLKYIKKGVDWFFFEYYSFKFPVIRNAVAHGGLVDGDVENTAIDLLLDLLPVCGLAVSKELPVNNALVVLKSACDGNSKSLLEWLSLRKEVKIPDFYNMNKEIKKAEGLYSSKKFWDYLGEELKKVEREDEIRNNIAVKSAGLLKTEGIAVDRANEFLKSSVSAVKELIKQRNARREGGCGMSPAKG